MEGKLKQNQYEKNNIIRNDAVHGTQCQCPARQGRFGR